MKNPDKGRVIDKGDAGLLHKLDKHFTDERNEHCHYGQGCQEPMASAIPFRPRHGDPCP